MLIHKHNKFPKYILDGYTKTVAESNIIFGDFEKTLPILNHTVSVLAVGNCMKILDQLTESPKYLILTQIFDHKQGNRCTSKKKNMGSKMYLVVQKFN
jgi:hypothetical protein